MANLPTILFVKRKKSKNPRGAQAFFSKNLNFFEFFLREGGGRRQILGFGAVCRLADSVVFGDFGSSKSHLRRLSIGLVTALSRFCRQNSGLDFLCLFLKASPLAGTRPSLFWEDCERQSVFGADDEPDWELGHQWNRQGWRFP